TAISRNPLSDSSYRDRIDGDPPRHDGRNIHMVQQSLTTPTELLHFQLRTAMSMENDSLAALGELRQAAKSAEVKELFKHHADETKEQIENLKKVFELLELKESTAPSP